MREHVGLIYLDKVQSPLFYYWLCLSLCLDVKNELRVLFFLIFEIVTAISVLKNSKNESIFYVFSLTKELEEH